MHCDASPFGAFSDDLRNYKLVIAYELFPRQLFVNYITSYTSYLPSNSDVSRTKSQNLNVSGLIFQLSLLNPVKLRFKSRMKM